MAELRLPAGQQWHRPWLAVGLAGGAATLLVVGVTGLPSATAELPAIARHAMQIALPQWGTTEVVSEIVYGSRGWDTFGETFLLLAAVSAVALLSRGREPRDEYVGEASAGVSEQAAADPHESTDREESQARDAEEEEEEDAAAEDADDDPLGEPAPERAVSMTVVVRVASRAAALLLTVVAFYIVLWGYTPGGGFPAGAALAGVVILLYAALGHRAVRAVVRPVVLEPIELAGAALIVAVGLVGLAREGSFLDNWLPLAPQQTIRSGGTLQLFSGAEVVEVATGIVIAAFSLLGMRHEWSPDCDDVNDDGDDGGDGGDDG